MTPDYEALLAIALPDDDCPACQGEGERITTIEKGFEVIGTVTHPCQCRVRKVNELIVKEYWK